MRRWLVTLWKPPPGKLLRVPVIPQGAREPLPLYAVAAARPERFHWLRVNVRKLRSASLFPLLCATVLIFALGAVEDVYGNTDTGDVYGSDGVQYLDIARALTRHDWRSALNPLWSQGYPALLAVTHVLFPATPAGDWWTSRAANFCVFACSYAAFLVLVFTLLPSRDTDDETEASRKSWFRRVGVCLLLFTAVQTCMGQVSRVNPDELVTTFFLLACVQLVRLQQRTERGERLHWQSAAALGLTLGVGFLVKAIFLALGSGMLAIAGLILWRKRKSVTSLLPAVAVFAIVVAAYGAALSHAVGYPTLGEASSINYAWHVDRLQKWVHWEGGVQPASEAWPKPFLARFAQWETHPPDFGTPLHPSAVLQRSPKVYGFASPVHATYVPYFDPPYFYQGYHHVFRLRYQLIATVKCVGDLLQVLARQPLAWALGLALALVLRAAQDRRRFVRGLRSHWPLIESSLLGILFYLTVHLEGRYIAGMLLVLGTCALLSLAETAARTRTAFATLLLVGFLAELALYQTPAWRNFLDRKAPQRNAEWRMGVAALQQHLPADAPVGVIAWTPNLHSDWAYIAHLQITGEIASGPDYDRFWSSSPELQAATLATFRRTGAVAVFVNNKPPGSGGLGWQQLSGTPLWMFRLQ